MSEIEVSVTVGGVEYSAQLVAGAERSDGATKVSIYRNSAVRGAAWVGAGWWVGRIDGFDYALVGAEAYNALDFRLKIAIGRRAAAAAFGQLQSAIGTGTPGASRTVAYKAIQGLHDLDVRGDVWELKNELIDGAVTASTVAGALAVLAQLERGEIRGAL